MKNRTTGKSIVHLIAACAVLGLSHNAAAATTNADGTALPRSDNDPRAIPPGAETTPALHDLGPLRLEAAIEIALANNPEVAAAGHDAAAAQARRDAAWGARLPTLTAEGAYTRTLDDQRLVPARYNGEPGTYSDSIFSGDLVLRVPLFTGGKLVSEARAANLLSQAAEQRLSRTRQELIFNVTSVFYSILAQEKLIGSLVFSQEALNSHLERVANLIEAQKAARVDRLRTEVRLADVRQRTVREESALAVLQQLLLNLMGVLTPEREVQLQGALDEVTAASPTLNAGLAAAFAYRPDYLAARNELESQARQVDAARAGHWPTVGLFGAYGGRWAEDPTRSLIGTDDSEDVGLVGIGVDLPLFEGGRIQARAREERARLAAAEERLRKLELQIRLEVETALLNLASAYERIRTLRKSVEQAQESLRIERQNYELGKGAIVDVLDAQAALLEAETSYYRALAEAKVARAQIELAMGGSRG